MRLILFAPVTRRMFNDKVRQVTCDFSRAVEWENVAPLTFMPAWAADKHTYRGKYGCDTSNVLKEDLLPTRMTEEQFHEFHGPRQKRDLESFFSEGVMCAKQSLEVNPYWEHTKQIYRRQPSAKQQKTKAMTQKYYAELKASHPHIFLHPTAVLKRKTDGDLPEGLPSPKRFRGPLLQQPTGAGKVYTCADLSAHKVIKGPYRKQTALNKCLFFNRAMHEAIGDPHTQALELEAGSYVSFPLLQGKGASMQLLQKDFKDPIAKEMVEGVDFLERKSLGIVQLHRLTREQFCKLPVSIWAHFIFRYALNIGDSGLYNAITDTNLSFLYGIDMEEYRGPIAVDKRSKLIAVMFTKAPAKLLSEAILALAKVEKLQLLELISKPIDYAHMGSLAMQYDVNYDRNMFLQRIHNAQRLVSLL